MASGQTAHLGLSQWADTDYVCNEDFNVDNQKLDSAISALETAVSSTGAVKLLSGALTQSASGLTIDVSGINLTQYRFVYLDLVGSTAADKAVHVLLNDTTEDTYSYLPGSGTMGGGICKLYFRRAEATGKDFYRVQFNTFTSGSLYNGANLTAFCVSPTGGIGSGTMFSGLTWAGVNTISLVPQSTSFESLKYSLWGEK